MLIVRPTGCDISVWRQPASVGRMTQDMVIEEVRPRAAFSVACGDMIQILSGRMVVHRDRALLSTTPRMAYDLDKHGLMKLVRESVASGEWGYHMGLDESVVITDPAGLGSAFLEPDVATRECAKSALLSPGSIEARSGGLFLRVFHRRLWAASTPTDGEQSVRHADAYGPAYSAMRAAFTIGQADWDDVCTIIPRGGEAWWEAFFDVAREDPKLFSGVSPGSPFRVSVETALRLLEYAGLKEWQHDDPPFALAMGPGARINLDMRVPHVAYI